MQSILRRLARTFRHYEPAWRYGFNLAPTLSYRLRSRSLPQEAKQLLSDLNRDGVAITSAGALFERNEFYNELMYEVEELEQERTLELSHARKSAEDQGAIGNKTFNIELLGNCPVLDPNSVYARFALQESLLQIVSAYFGMYARLRYYNVWHTFATAGEARESQLWHRDREDFKILKVFVYLSDVDAGAGALTYARGSQRARGLKSNPEFFVEGGVKRSKDEQMAVIVPPERWMQATGPTGTIVFADTSGYHKGGLARDRDRLMYVCMFTSPSSQSKELFRRCGEPARSADKALTFALSKSADRK